MGLIADYVATLTPAEREQFKDLIEECARRETEIQSSALRSAAALTRLAEQHRRLAVGIRDLERAGQGLMDAVSRVYLKAVPPPRTFH
jgi:hypothetical protein